MSQRFRIPSRGARPRTSRAWLALLLAVVCGCDADPPRSDGGAWDWDAGCPPDTVCETSWCTSDGDPSNDVGTLVLPIDTLELPVSSDPTVMAGLDIDGQTTQADSDSAGCFVRDTVESPTSTRRTVDNGVAFAAPSLLPLGLDLSRAFAASVDRSVGTPPGLDATLRLETWNGTPNDGCVGFHVDVAGTEVAQSVTALSGGVSPSVRLPLASIPLVLHLVRSGCTPDAMRGIPCEADVHVRLENVFLRADVKQLGDAWRLVTSRPLENDLLTSASRSLLGGSIRFWDQDSRPQRRTCNDGLANGDGTLADELARAAPRLGLDPTGATALCEAFAARLDLRLPPPSDGHEGAPVACWPDANSSTGLPNAISIGLFVGAGYVSTTTHTP